MKRGSVTPSRRVKLLPFNPETGMAFVGVHVRILAALMLAAWLNLNLSAAEPLSLEDYRFSASEQKAVDQWRLCGRSGLLPELPPPAEPPAEGELKIEADRIEAGDGQTRLLGDVSVVSRKDRARAGQAVLDRDRQHMELSGNVHYRSELLDINADSFSRDTDGQASEAAGLTFFIPVGHVTGNAERMVRPDEQTTHLYDLTYTTCDPNDREWYFKAEEMTLNHASGFGTGKHMTVRLKDIPILYFPYLSFPIDERRKTGLLYPTLGESTRHGYEFRMPWYWNIAPQADATISPHWMSERGLKLDTEWRYLSDWSENELVYEQIDDEDFGETRSLIGLKHSGRIGRSWSTRVSAAEVSDVDYFEDFGTDLSATSRVQLSRTASITGSWRNWKLVSRVQSFQPLTRQINPGNAPYRLMPEVALTGLYPDFALGLDFDMESTYTRFDQDRRLNAERLDIWPRLSRPFGSAGWFITPAVGARYTSYRLDYPDDIQPPANQPLELSRSTPVASLDTGLIFERSFGAEGGYVQTLEPRIFYLNVPFREQDDIPIFDTNQPTFSFYQLFQENRFVGADRMGDANHYSTALTTRVIERGTGEERVRFSLGQIRYLKDRRVTRRPADEPETGDRSGLILEAESKFADYWSTSLTAERNPETGRADKGLFRLRYNRNNRYVFNLGYRYRRAEPSRNRDELRQTDVSFNLPVGGRWSVAGRWNRDVREKLTLEQFLGIEYESCCWAFRVLAREFLTSVDDFGDIVEGGARNFDNAVYFELSFKGLARAGGDIGRRLEHGIIGYQDPYE